MTTHVEHGAFRSASYPPFSTLAGAIWARVKAWRQGRIEHPQIAAREALAPENLDEIRQRIENGEMPRNFIPVFNPYAIVASAVFAPRPVQRDEF